MIINGVDVKDFSGRVERLCDFLITELKPGGVRERTVLEDLVKDARYIQCADEIEPQELRLFGLANHVLDYPDSVKS